MRLVETWVAIDILEILVAEMDENTFTTLFPVKMEHYDPLAFPEPTMGAVVELDDGLIISVLYGFGHHRISISRVKGQVIAQTLASLYREVPQLSEYVLWDANNPEDPVAVCSRKSQERKSKIKNLQS